MKRTYNIFRRNRDPFVVEASAVRTCENCVVFFQRETHTAQDFVVLIMPIEGIDRVEYVGEEEL